MPAKTLFFLNKRKGQSKTTKVPIYARVTYDFTDAFGMQQNRKLVLPTGYIIEIGKFLHGKVKPFNADATTINASLAGVAENIESRYNQYLKQKEFPTESQFKQAIISSATEVSEARDFYKDFDLYVEYLKDKGTSQYHIYSVKQTISHVKAMAASKKFNVDYTTINLAFYAKMKSYCRDLELKQNTFSKYIKVVKSFLNYATAMGWNKHHFYKHPEFKIKDEQSHIVALNESEVENIAALDLSKRQWVDLTRDYFLLACEFGLRFGDYSRIKKANVIEVEGGYNLNVKTSKTGATVTIPISERAMKILLKHNFELPAHQSNQKFNECLKTIAKLAKIDKIISSHTGRKTFATIQEARQVPRSLIMRITGHKTEREYLKYVGIDGTKNAEMVRTQAPELYTSKPGLLERQLKVV